MKETKNLIFINSMSLTISFLALVAFSYLTEEKEFLFGKLYMLGIAFGGLTAISIAFSLNMDFAFGVACMSTAIFLFGLTAPDIYWGDRVKTLLVVFWGVASWLVFVIALRYSLKKDSYRSFQFSLWKVYIFNCTSIILFYFAFYFLVKGENVLAVSFALPVILISNALGIYDIRLQRSGKNSLFAKKEKKAQEVQLFI